MITHIVLFKLADPAPENLAATRNKLLSMDGKIALLRHLEAGIDVIRSRLSPVLIPLKICRPIRSIRITPVKSSRI